MKITLTSRDRIVFSDLQSPAADPSSHLPDGILISEPKKDEQSLHAFELPEIIEFGINFAAGVGAGVVANWIWKIVEGRVTKVVIDGSEVQLERNEIEEAVERVLARRRDE